MTAPTMAEAGSDWVAHDADRCPVAKGTRLEVRYRCGVAEFVDALIPTNEWRDGDARFWVSSDGHPNDIVAYRIVRS